MEVPEKSQDPNIEFLPVEDALPESDRFGARSREKRKIKRGRERWNERYTAWKAGESEAPYFIDKYDGHRCLKWTSNGSVVPVSVFEDAHMQPHDASDVSMKSQRKAYKAETRDNLEEYRSREECRERTAEEKFEMRAAFGEGSTVRNVITGEKTEL